MSDLPGVSIVMTTYFPPDERGPRRIVVAMNTLDTWVRHLRYDGVFGLHIADDGTDEKILGDVRQSAANTIYNLDTEDPSPRLRWNPLVELSRGERHGVGASLNRGIIEAIGRQHLVLYAVDDWALTQDFDITPWVRLLLEEQGIGAVRLGPPHPHIGGTVMMFSGGWALRLDRHHYAASQRPTLFHPRFWAHYGLWPEDCSAIDCERVFNERFCRSSGPDIALALPHPWEPQYSDELSAIDPTKG